MLLPIFQRMFVNPAEYLAGKGPQHEQLLQEVTGLAQEDLQAGETEVTVQSLALFSCKARLLPCRLHHHPILFEEDRLRQEAGA